MAEEKTKKLTIHEEELEKEDPTELQKKIEQKIERDEDTLTGEELSGQLSKGRTHMSEHRTKMSEHRTELSEHRTDLSEHRTALSEHRTALSEHRSELSKHRTELSEHRSALSQDRTNLSFERTALSYERTLMSWIRTATSLITFGFTIYKFFQEVQKETTGRHLFTPRMVGMIMIGFGVIGLLFAEIQHLTAYNKLKKEYPEIQLSLSSILGALILAVGLLLFFAALFRQ
jgi:putative membrane protein